MASCEPATRIKGLEGNVWVEFGDIALKYNPVNLGLGCPDFAASDNLTKELLKSSSGADYRMSQYTRSFGHPRLINALSKLYSGLMGRSVNSQSEILITIGATEAIYCTIMGLVNPGDEVIVIEPYFDAYEPMIKMAGGVPVFIPLKPRKSSGMLTSADWILDPLELQSKFTQNTKMIIVNTPHNPIGKVFSRSELEQIATLAKKNDAIVLMDEVYEWIIYAEFQHVRLASFPNMWERTITVGSAGKTFSVTGWKIGWAMGPPNLLKALQIIHLNCVYTCPTNIQEALAVTFEKELLRLNDSQGYWNNLVSTLQMKRELICGVLNKVGMSPTIPEGGYFVVANFKELASKINIDEPGDWRDFKFAKWMSKKKKLQTIPLSAFYSEPNKHMGEDYVRICFIKEDETLSKAAKILEDLRESL